MNHRMKLNWLVPLALSAASSLYAAEPAKADSAPPAALQSFPKNLARQHLGANLLVYNPSTQNYVPTEAAAAWLDDDVATGWPAQSGHQYYLLTLPEPQLINNFCISMRS